MSEQKLDLILSKLDKLNIVEEKLNTVEATLNNVDMQLSSRMSVIEEALSQQNRAIEILEKKVRRNNLLFFGVPEEETDLATIILATINSMPDLNYTQDQIDAIYRLGRTVKAGRSRPVVVEFASFKWKDRVFSNRGMLPQNCNIYMKLDLPAGLRKRPSPPPTSRADTKKRPPGTPSPPSKPPNKKLTSTQTPKN